MHKIAFGLIATSVHGALNSLEFTSLSLPDLDVSAIESIPATKQEKEENETKRELTRLAEAASEAEDKVNALLKLKSEAET
jgi:hypothetical protein